MWRYCQGFRAGAIHIDEEIKVLVEYRDSGDRERLFVDETWGMERAQSLIKRGVDVIFAAGGATGQGALRAASEAGIRAIGAERDQAAALGEAGSGVVTSVYGRAGFEVQALIRSLREGNFNDPIVGQFGFVPLNERFAESLTREMEALSTGLSSGEVRTNVTFRRP
jgi:basic membrane protein A